MTVQELIEKLKKADPQMEVLRYDSLDPGYFRLRDAKVMALAQVDRGEGVACDYDLPGEWPENPSENMVVIM